MTTIQQQTQLPTREVSGNQQENDIFHLMDIRQIIFRYKEVVVKKDTKQFRENYAAVLEQFGEYTRGVFTRPIRLSKTLAKFCGTTTTTTVKLTKLLCNYIQNNNLLSPFPGTISGTFVLDGTLANALDIEPGTTLAYYELRTLTKPHITHFPLNPALKYIHKQPRVQYYAF
jgi:chromatin remodeling complex protein RSC6